MQIQWGKKADRQCFKSSDILAKAGQYNQSILMPVTFETR